MARGSSGRQSAQCQAYLNNRTRIKNKTRRLEARIKGLKSESQEAIRKACPIGRMREKGSGKG